MFTIDSSAAHEGPGGEVALAAGKSMSMRLWRSEDPHDKPSRRSDHETLGYVILGRAELIIEGESFMLAPGVSYLVPAHAEHTYRIIDTFTAVECVSPPLGRAKGFDTA